jgi:hypothetical protein
VPLLKKLLCCWEVVVGAIFTYFAASPINPPFFYTLLVVEIHNALVISGRHNGLAFFGDLAGTFTQCTGVIPKLHPRHYKTSAVAPELAANKS